MLLGSINSQNMMATRGKRLGVCFYLAVLLETGAWASRPHLQWSIVLEKYSWVVAWVDAGGTPTLPSQAKTSGKNIR